MGLTVPICKFVGTVSLGLLTGVSYTTASQSVPSLFILPSASSANATFQHSQTLTTRHISALSVLSISTYSLAYILSRKESRHPYLLWTTLVVAAGAGLDFFLLKRERELREQEHGKIGRKPSSTVDEEDYEDVNSSVRLNGEEVKKAMESWQFRETVRAGVSGFAFSMGIIGLWGDWVIDKLPAVDWSDCEFVMD